MSAKLCDDESFSVESPPLFEEFMAELQSIASRKVKEYYRLSDNVQIPHYDAPFRAMVMHFSSLLELDINEDLIFRGNIWRVLLDIDKATHPKMFLKKLYDCTITWGEAITSIDELMEVIEDVVRGQIVLNIRKVTMFKSKHKKKVQKECAKTII